MHALRAGLKRNKERKLKEASSDELIDGSTFPILSFEDSKETSPARNPISWDDIKLPLEDLPTVTSRFQSQYDSIEDLPGDESRLLNPELGEQTDEYDENRPPIDNHSKSKAMKFTRWKQSSRTGESQQPLLVDPMANNFKAMDANRLTSPPRNFSRWDPIEHDETTEPLGQISMNNSKGIMSSKLRTNCESQAKHISWNQKKQSIRGDRSVERVRKTSKKTTHTRTTFDPFECTDDLEQENDQSDFQQHHDFSTANRNLEVQETERMTEQFEQSSVFWEFHRGGNARFGNQHHPDVESFPNLEYPSMNLVRSDYDPDFFDREMHPGQESCWDQNEQDFTEKNLTQKDQNAVEDPIKCVESSVMGSANYFNEHETYHRGNEFHQNEIDHSEEYLDREDEGDFDEDFDEESTQVSEEMYSLRKMEHIRSLYDSKFLGGNSDPQEKETEEEDQSMATSLHSETAEDVGNIIGLTLVALISEFSGTLQQRTEQERAISILEARKISNVERVDGSSLCNKDRRNMLFDISGERGKYPQFFLQKDPNIIIYLGGFEWLQYMNDIGSLNDETIFGVSHTISEPDESTQITELNNAEVNGCDSHVQKSSDVNPVDRHLSFSDRAMMFDIYKKKEFIDGASPTYQASEIEELSYGEEEVDSLNSKEDDFAMSSGSGFASGTTFQADNVLHSLREIQSIANEITNSKDSTHATEQEELCSDKTYCELSNIENTKNSGDSEVLNTVNEADLEVGHSETIGAVTIEQPAPKSDLNDSTCEAEEISLVQLEEHRNAKALLDTASEIYGVLSQSSSSPIELEREAETSSSMTNDNKNLFSDVESYSDKDETPEKISTRDIPLHTQNELDEYNDLDETESSRFERDDQMSKEEIEKLARRRARWKRRIIAEHLGKKSSDVSESEDPIGASLSEIEMINKFLTLLGPDFDGSLSSNQLEDVYCRSENAGLTKEFTDKMLNQTITSDDDTYDDHEFTRKTPEAQYRIDCLVDTFWAESSNVVGGDAVENIQAALSGDGDSKWGLRSTESNESNSGWRAGGVIESIKATLSGENGEKGWRSGDVIESIKATLSGEGGEKGWRSGDVIGNIKANFSGESSERSWRSSDVIGSIKAAFSADGEKNDEDEKPEPEGLKVSVDFNNVEAADLLVNGPLHDC